MTLKQKKFIRELSNNNYNISKTMKKVGYSNQTSISGTQYNRLRKITNKLDFFDPEKIKKDINSTRRMAKEKKDITNLNRIDEHRARIAGMIIDKAQVDNKNPDKIVIVHEKQKVDH